MSNFADAISEEQFLGQGSTFEPATVASDVPSGFVERGYREATPEVIEGSEEVGKNPYSTQQMDAANYALIMIEVDKQLRQLSKNFDPTNAFDNLIAPNLPFIGDQIRSRLSSFQKRQYNRLTQRFIEMVLRDETGAAATFEEVERLKQVFLPDFGWATQDLKELDNIRQLHIKRSLATAGRAYPYAQKNIEDNRQYLAKDADKALAELIKMARYEGPNDGSERHKIALENRAKARAFLDEKGIEY